MTKQLTRDELHKFINDNFKLPQTPLDTVTRWERRGDGVAIYRNVDLGSRDLGSFRMVSFGSPAAQLETDTPPQRLPDIGDQINWRFQLEATYRPMG